MNFTFAIVNPDANALEEADKKGDELLRLGDQIKGKTVVDTSKKTPKPKPKTTQKPKVVEPALKGDGDGDEPAKPPPIEDDPSYCPSSEEALKKEVAAMLLSRETLAELKKYQEDEDWAGVYSLIAKVSQEQAKTKEVLEAYKVLAQGQGVSKTGDIDKVIKGLLSDAQQSANVPTIRAFLANESPFAANVDRYPYDMFAWKEHTSPLKPDFLGRKFLANLLGDMPYTTYKSTARLTMTAYTENASMLEAISAAKEVGAGSLSKFTRFNHFLTGCEDDPNEVQDYRAELEAIKDSEE